MQITKLGFSRSELAESAKGKVCPGVCLRCEEATLSEVPVLSEGLNCPKCGDNEVVSLGLLVRQARHPRSSMTKRDMDAYYDKAVKEFERARA